jgi:hypothetical protein
LFAVIKLIIFVGMAGITIDFDNLGVNPLAESLKVNVTRVYDSSKLKADKDGIMLPVWHDLERQQCVKLFYSPTAKLIISKLKPAGKDLLYYILYNLDGGCDYIVLDKDKYMRMHDVHSVNTYKKAIAELCKVGLIYPNVSYPKLVFWINPNYFFSGSRTTKYSNKVVVKSERTL